MRNGQSRDEEIEALLRETFPDDLPPEIEHRLKAEARSLWQRASQDTASGPGRRIASLREPGAGPVRITAFARTRQAWLVAASLLLIVSGGVFQATSPSGLAAASLSVQQACVRSLSRLNRVTRMTCVVEPGTALSDVVRYDIEWSAPDLSRVRLVTPDGVSDMTFRFGPRPATIAESRATRNRVAAGHGLPAGSHLEAVRSFLAPFEVARLLEGQWRPLSVRQGGDTGHDWYRVSRRDLEFETLVEIDRITHLPLRIELQPAGGAPGAAPALVARFRWEGAARSSCLTGPEPAGVLCRSCIEEKSQCHRT